MSTAPDELDADRLGEIQEQLDAQGAVLREIAERVGSAGPPPNDPTLAGRWELPLSWHALHLGESIHALRNSIQVLLGMIERVGAQMSDGAGISLENKEAIKRLDIVCQNIEASALEIKDSLQIVRQYKPVLMRDLWWMPTESMEIGLIVVLGGEAVFNLVGSETLIKSAMFQAMSRIIPSAGLWALVCAALAIGSVISLLSRRRVPRMIAAWSNTSYFGVTAILPVLYFPGALGSLHHAVFCLSALWIVSRGPSNAI